MRKIAQTISIVFYPVFMPIWALVFLFFGRTPWCMIDLGYKISFMTQGLVMTSAVPLTYAIACLLFGTKEDLMMEDAKKRLQILIYILMGTFICYVCVTSFTRGLDVEPVKALVHAEMWMMLVTLVITPMTKISMHSMGIGAFFAYVVVIFLLSGQSFAAESIVLFAITGLVAWARLKLEAHTGWQLLLGFGAGIVLMLLSLSYNILRI